MIPKRTAIIYLSLTGNTDKIAQELANKLKQVDLFPIKIAAKVPNLRWLKTLKFGYKTVLNKKVEYVFKVPDFRKYDLVIFGSPVWIGLMPPPFRRVVQDLDLKDISIALYFTFENEIGQFIKRFVGVVGHDDFIAMMPLKVDRDFNIEGYKMNIDKFIGSITNMKGKEPQFSNTKMHLN